METVDPRAALDRLVQQMGESYAALSRMIGRNDAYLQQFMKRGSPRTLSERDRRLLAGYFRVDEAVLGGPAGAARTMVTVRRLEATASAGPGTFAEDDRHTGDEIFDPALLARLGVGPEHSAVLRAQGDSMAPTILDGDLMLIDERDRRLRTRAAIFVLRLDGVLLVKRLARAAAGVTITSDNPAYPTITAAGVDVVGRVVWLSRAL